MAFWKSQKGIHSLEVIISVAIFALLITGIFILFGSSISEGEGMMKRSRADALISEGMNAVRAIRDRDASLLTEGDHGIVLNGTTWEFSGTEDQTEGVFLRKIIIDDFQADGFDVTVDVAWPFWGRLISRRTSTRLTDWRNVEAWGDWGSPIVVGSLDIGPQGRAMGIDRNGNVIYLTADTSSGKVPTFFTADITDLTAPFIIDSEIISADQLDVIHVPNTDIVYVVGEETDEEYIQFDVSDPANIIKTTSFDLNADGLSVAILDNLFAVGTSQGVQIYDITNPNTPIWLSTYTVSANVNNISMIDDRLYAATSKDDQEILILSISDPANPTFVGSFDLSGSNDALSIEVKGNSLYLGREAGSGDELFKFDRSNPDNLTILDSEEVGGDINDLAIGGPYVYLATAVNNQEFQIFTTGASGLTYMIGLNMAQVANGITFDDNTIFISLRSNDAFQIIQPSP